MRAGDEIRPTKCTQRPSLPHVIGLKYYLIVALHSRLLPAAIPSHIMCMMFKIR